MRSLIYSAAAAEDLANILDYITRESTSLAIGLRFTDELRAKCAKLASLPGTIGRERPELGHDIRSFSVKNHVIFFRYQSNVFEVLNILEGHRDIISYFADDDV